VADGFRPDRRLLVTYSLPEARVCPAGPFSRPRNTAVGRPIYFCQEKTPHPAGWGTLGFEFERALWFGLRGVLSQAKIRVNREPMPFPYISILPIVDIKFVV